MRRKSKSEKPRQRPNQSLRRLNKHINFDREGDKGNARKDETRITCCKCKKKFTLPFKPRRPDVYCDDCFKKKKKVNFLKV